MSAADVQQGLPTIWWQVLLRGSISLLLGLLMLALPHASVQAYEEIFGAYVLADGLLLITQVLPVRKMDKRAVPRLLHGAIGIFVGTAVFLWPEFREMGMANIFSTYLMLAGALQIFTALDLYRIVRYDYYLMVSGFISILCGLLLKIAPANDTLLLARIFGIFMTAYALIAIMIAFEMRKSTGHYSADQPGL
jgi:uncharacterized membrane protein HdeD (DUF308 family)